MTTFSPSAHFLLKTLFTIISFSMPRDVCFTSLLYFILQSMRQFQVDWGESTMIQAERILLRNALKDSLNERFAFISDRYVLPS